MLIYCFKDGFYFLKAKKLIYFLHGLKGDVNIDLSTSCENYWIPHYHIGVF